MNQIIILFGEIGVGKNYHGERLAQHLDYAFFDGDCAATAEMIDRVSKFQPLTREIITRYIQSLSVAIIMRATKYRGLVVAQALYADQDRKKLADTLYNCNYAVEFRWVKVSMWQNIRQLLKRKDGLRWVWYWLINKPFFQKPTHHYSVIRG